MKGISELRRGRGLTSRRKRLRLRRRQPRYAGTSLRSAFRAAPVTRHIKQPYLPSGANLADLLR
jgi:hypothetical protein